MNQHLLSVLRCVNPGPSGDVCAGSVRADDQELACERCGGRFPVIRGVPLLHPGKAGEKREWFEKMYEGRSRDEEIKSDYLRKERNLVARLCGELCIRGPSLEIGCGVGLFAGLVNGYIGLEYSLHGLFASGFELFDRLAGDAACLPFRNGSMQMIFSFNTLEHIAAIDRVFSEMDRVCAPSGYLVLKPAWHCTKYRTELVDILPYSKLSFRNRFVKAMLPVLRSRPYKFITHVPWRLGRRLTAGRAPGLRWTPLVPYHGPLWEADTDAEVSLDSHEAILYFTRRDYDCISHRRLINQILAGHDVVVLRKPFKAAGPHFDGLGPGPPPVRDSSSTRAEGCQ